MNINFISIETLPIKHLNVGTIVRLIRLNEYPTAAEQAQRLVDQEFGSFDIKSKITEITKREFNDRYSGI